VPALRELAALDRPRLLVEDRARAAMYAQDARRQELAGQVPDIGRFLQELGMKATVGRCTPLVLERVHQLIQKTNQFNLTTRRHDIDEVSRLARSPEAEVAWLRLADRFGDMGLVCVGIIRQVDQAVWEIDTLLMSCRVMGRQVEAAFLAYLFELATGRGARRLRGVFRPTAKNRPVQDLYPTHGFTQVQASEAEVVYERDAVAQPYPWPSLIARIDEVVA
jgi:FkbH-like protein